MPVSFEYDAAKGIIHVRPRGNLLLSEVGERFKRVAADETIPPGAVEFVHLDGVDSFKYGSRESAGIPDMHALVRQKKRIKATVFIAESDYHFGVARMVQTWFDAAGLGLVVAVVRSEEEAYRFVDRLSI
ncbi:MAG: hypothetical protein GY838_17325 [bacterium]|nr:hypothetical protein [bacterium]